MIFLLGIFVNNFIFLILAKFLNKKTPTSEINQNLAAGACIILS
jgi:hypothetical protein